MTNLEENKITTNYKLLSEQLILVSKELNACKEFIEDVKLISDKKSFIRFFRRRILDIAERLNCDLPDENEIDYLNEDIKDLKREISNLEDTISEYEDRFGKNKNLLSEEYKLRWFLENKEKYTEWELKDLLENGKK
jgi:predicted  nucleic acid-binding Zn-ribbon protein